MLGDTAGPQRRDAESDQTHAPVGEQSGVSLKRTCDEGEHGATFSLDEALSLTADPSSSRHESLDACHLNKSFQQRRTQNKAPVAPDSIHIRFPILKENRRQPISLDPATPRESSVYTTCDAGSVETGPAATLAPSYARLAVPQAAPLPMLPLQTAEKSSQSLSSAEIDPKGTNASGNNAAEATSPPSTSEPKKAQDCCSPAQTPQSRPQSPQLKANSLIDEEDTSVIREKKGKTNNGAMARTDELLRQHFDGPKQEKGHELFGAIQDKQSIFRRLSELSMRGTLTTINLSQRGLRSNDAYLLKLAILQSPHLSVLKLGYNSLGDDGAAMVASAVIHESQHHSSLSVIDLGFNCVGDPGCTALAMYAVAGNHCLRTLYLSGNSVGERGALSLAGAVLGGCGLTCLHLTANRIGSCGVKALTRAVAESEAQRCVVGAKKHYRAGSGTSDGIFGAVQELHLGGTAMQASGCLSVSNMLLTNFSLRVLSLSDNGIEDRDLILFSQSLSRNRSVPLEVLQLSFNRITCVGVESLMNSVWGSKTLCEIRLDNNRIHDRGAQLAAVVLKSVDLEVLDLGFNKMTTVGIRALMKSLSENDSLKSLTLSGNPLDSNASKAVSYALAYNSSLRAFYVDNCSVGFSAQRHIAAGIVSNSKLSLRVVTGFLLGPVTVTLGLPAAMERWSNEQVLRFIRLMWDRKCHEPEVMWSEKLKSSIRNTQSHNVATTDGISLVDVEEGLVQKQQKHGPSDPKTVVAAAKNLFALLGDAGGALLRNESQERGFLDNCPLVPNDAVLVERSLSGNLAVPTLNDSSTDDATQESQDSAKGNVRGPFQSSELPESCSGGHLSLSNEPHDPERRTRNMEWLKLHFQSLNDVAQLPFSNADLWQLHQYFFSPIDDSVLVPEVKGDPCVKPTTSGKTDRNIPVQKAAPFDPCATNTEPATPVPLSSRLSLSPALERKLSYQSLNDTTPATCSDVLQYNTTLSASGRRRKSCGGDVQPATKKARNNKPRIAYYPRIREKLEMFRSKASQHQTLVLLRQLKYVEKSMFCGTDVHSKVGGELPLVESDTSDVDMILVDML